MLRPIVSIVVYNKNDTSIKSLADSLEKIDKKYVSRAELNLVVFNKKVSDENYRLAMSLKRFMPVRFIDFLGEETLNTPNIYSRSKHNFLVKEPDSTVTESELVEIIKKEVKIV